MNFTVLVIVLEKLSTSRTLLLKNNKNKKTANVVLLLGLSTGKQRYIYLRSKENLLH